MSHRAHEAHGVDSALLATLLSGVSSRADNALIWVLLAIHDEMLACEPPTIATGCMSLSLPSRVPW